MRILVIGGTQFIGPPIVKRLVASGHDVTVFHRGRTEGDLPPNVEHIHGDREQLAEFAGEFRRLQPEVVLDMAAFTEQDAQAVMRTFPGVARRVVAISSQDVYRAYGRLHGTEPGSPEPVPFTEDAPLREKLFPYRGSGRNLDHYDKILVERAVRSNPLLPGAVLRLPMVYGEGDNQHRLLTELKRMDDKRPAILLEERFAGWRWTRAYVENVAAAIALAVNSESARTGTYNVGEADALSYADWVREIARAAWWLGEVVIVPEDRLPPKLRPPAGDYRQDLVADTTRIRRELGHMEPVSRFEALRRTVEWERANRPEGAEKLFDYEAEDAVLAEVKQGDARA